MGFGERLRMRRMELGLSRNELAERIVVTPSSIANYENGISYPKPDILISLIGALDIDANYLYQDYLSNNIIENIYGSNLSDDEKDSIAKYRRLTDNGKHLVRMVIEEEYQRTLKNEWVVIPCCQPGVRKLHLGFIMKERKQRVRVKRENLPDGTDFCFQVQVDRYEPVFRKYDVLALSSCPAQHNEMGLFILNGVCYVRTLSEREGMRRLCALNVMDPPIEIRPGDDLQCMGRILGKLYGEYELED